MLASPEAARFVLVTQAHLFKPTYPRSKERMIGPQALFFHQGDYHMRLRKLVQGSLSPDALRGRVPDIERIVISMLESWYLCATLASLQFSLQLSFDVGILTIFGGRLDERYKVELKKNYFIVDKGYNSFPTYIPGTPYHKAIQARKRLRGILSEIMKERRTKGVTENDLLGCLMDSRDERGEHLNDDQIADNIIGVLFAAQDTTASVMTWVLKFLHDHPKLLESVKVRTPKHRVNDLSSRTNLLAGTLIGPRYFHVGGANGDPGEKRVRKSTLDMGSNAKHGSNSQGE
ncbi:hypothetical protein BHE74_00023012 [Ensete ventricosum]|uniref:Uncharacterized protein n=1 Tax=Ensete ventricosum TaxID=4639 RepID=A0A426YJK4_ENSVE|nr:hypothetical protein B296_00028838 [Ensete ventricosum]RWW69388.1 hypothetical protein BHE74_00023012 [Ensete ventricosum]RZS22513.1 hypothetical protein BHM03_00055295 [Ensete ventricosum]